LSAVFKNHYGLESANMIIRDMIERKLAEKALRESENKYRNLVDNMNDGIIITDENGSILFANNALARINGYNSPDKLLNRNFTEFIKTSARKEIIKNYEREIRLGKSINEIEIPIISANDSQVYVLVMPSIIRYEQLVTRMSWIIRDITERKRAEEALIQSETKYRTLVTQSPDGIYSSICLIIFYP
jgi:PAS domain S-box-containing protein